MFVDIFYALFPKKFNPDLIDLHDYAKELLLWKDQGIPPLPPHPIPELVDREWTCEEMEAMRKNRRLAQEVYERIINASNPSELTGYSGLDTRSS